VQDLDLGPLKEELRLTGRSPARHRTLVRAIRRVLWPFIRPYHFVTIEWARDRLAELQHAVDALRDSVVTTAPGQTVDADWIADLESRIDARVGERVYEQVNERIKDRVNEQVNERVNRDLVNANFRQSTLRAEVIAVGRQLDEWRSRVEASEQQLGTTSQTLSNLAAHVRDLAGMIGQGREALQATGARLTDMQDRHRNSVSLRLQQIERRLAVLASGKSGPEASPFTTIGTAAFELGDATFYESQFGPLILRPGDLITRQILQEGMWDAHLADAIEQGSKRGRVAVDAGAHFGVISCWMATLFDTVHAFEPNRETYVFLCANAALRKPGRIRPQNLALWSAPAVLSLANPGEQDLRIATDQPLESAFRAADNAGSLSFAPEGTGVNAVEARPIDEFALENVGFIKVDCQGADGHVIKGALDTIRRCRPVVVFEWEKFLAAPRGITLAEVEGCLNELGYEVKPLYSHNEKQVDYIATPRDAQWNAQS
jgi:FkbM family methyltransferase